MVTRLCHNTHNLSKSKPYFEDIIDSEYVLDVGLGVAIFVIVIFLVLMINKGDQ
jgi:membrane protein required for colicin V production